MNLNKDFEIDNKTWSSYLSYDNIRPKSDYTYQIVQPKVSVSVKSFQF